MRLYGYRTTQQNAAERSTSEEHKMRKLTEYKTEYEQGRLDALAGKHPSRATPEYTRGYEAGLGEIRCGLL